MLTLITTPLNQWPSLNGEVRAKQFPKTFERALKTYLQVHTKNEYHSRSVFLIELASFDEPKSINIELSLIFAGINISQFRMR